MRDWLSYIPQVIVVSMMLYSPSFALFTPIADVAQDLIKGTPFRKISIIKKLKENTEKALREAFAEAPFVMDDVCIDEMAEVLFSKETNYYYCYYQKGFNTYLQFEIYKILDKYDIPYKEQNLAIETVIDNFFGLLKNRILCDEDLRSFDTNIKVNEIVDNIQIIVNKIKELEKNIRTDLFNNSLDLIYIDQDYIGKRKIQSDSPIVGAYYEINDNIEVISKIVCSDYDIKNNSLLIVLRTQILKTHNEPLFVLGNGGIGKTTSLLRIAVDFAHERPVFFIRLKNEHVPDGSVNRMLDYIDELARQMCASALLIIDNPYVNADVLKIIYERLADNTMNIKPILIERINRMDLLLNDKDHQLYYWMKNANIVNLSAVDKRSLDGLPWMNTDNKIDHVIDTKWKQDVLKKMIDDLVLREKNIYKKTLEQSYNKIISTKHNLSIAEQRLWVIYEYNKFVETNTLTNTANISFDWDEWNELIEKQYDKNNNNTFVFLAALYLFKIPMRIEMLANIMGIKAFQLKPFLDEKFKNGLNEPVEYINDTIYLKHDIIADMFFSFFPRFSAQDYLMRIIHVMDDDTVADFEKTVFSKKYITGEKKAPCKVNPCALLFEFGKNKHYLDVLEERKRLYSYDLAIAWSKKGDDKQYELRKLLEKYPGHIRVHTAFLMEQEDISNYMAVIEKLPLPMVNNGNIAEVNEYGRLLHRFGNSDVAADIFKSIIAVKPDDIHSRMELGAIYKGKRELKKAEETYTYIIDNIKKDNLPTLNALGILYSEWEERKSDAEEMFWAALRIDCNNIQTLNAYGKYLRNFMKNDADAEKMFKRCLDIDNYHIHSINELGMLYASQRKYEEAIIMYKRSISIKSRNIPTLNAYGNLLRDMGNYEKATEKYKASLDIDKYEYSALYGIALINRLKGKREEAIRCFKDLHDKYPMKEDPLTNLGDLYIHENANIALEYLKKALEINPKNSFAIEKIEEIMPSDKIDRIMDKINSGEIISDKEIKLLCSDMLEKLKADDDAAVYWILKHMNENIKSNNPDVIRVQLEYARKNGTTKDIKKFINLRSRLESRGLRFNK